MKKGKWVVEFEKRGVYLASAAVSVFVMFFLMASPDDHGYNPRDLRCINYLVSGTLYGGQPECVQPPMMYIAGAFFWILSESHLEYFANLAIVVLNVFCLYAVMKMAGVSGMRLTAVSCITYCLLILPLTVGALDTALAFFFTVSAGYILLEGQCLEAAAVSGVLCAFALASKMTSATAIAAIFVAYATVIPRKRGWLRGVGSAFAVFFSPLAVSFLVLTLLYPNYVVYTILSHSHTEKLGYAAAAVGFITTNPLADYNVFIFYVIYIAVLYSYLRSGGILPVAYLVSSGLGMVYRFKAWGEAPNVLESYYIIYPLFFLLVIAIKTVSAKRVGRNALVLPAVLVLSCAFLGEYHLQGLQPAAKQLTMLTPEYAALEARAGALQKAVDGFYALLPENQGRVLASPQVVLVLNRTNTSIRMGFVDERENPPHQSKYLDVSFVPGLEYHKVIKSHSMGLYPDEIELAKEIGSGRYEMIFIGPKAHDTQIMYALDAADKGSLKDYCRVILPYFSRNKNDRFWSTIYLKNMRQCAKLRDDAFDYRDKIFGQVCAEDEWAANNIVYGILFYNYDISFDLRPLKVLSIDRRCKSGADLMGDIREYEGSNWVKASFFLFFAGVWIIFTSSTRGRHR